MRISYRRVLGLLILLTVLSTFAVLAQDNSGTPIHFAGHVQKVKGNTITIDQIAIDVNDAAAFKIGEAVVIDGWLHKDGTVVAQTVSIYTAPVATVQPIENVTLSGTVQTINQTILTVDGQTVVVQPDDPVLSTLQVGDQVSITGQRVGGDYVVAQTISPLGTAPVVVTIEGVVQAIHKNVITIEGQQIQFAPDDPMLHDFKVGDSLHVEGTYTQTADGQVIAVTSATVISSTETDKGKDK